MTEFVAWISENASAIVPIAASAISATAAIAAVLASLYIHHAIHRPDIVAYIEARPELNAVFSIVENIGRGAARNITVSDFDFNRICPQSIRGKAVGSFISKTLPMLVPDAMRETAVCDYGHASSELSDYSCTVRVGFEYRTPYLRRWKMAKDSFELDFCSISCAIYVDSDIHSIATSLKKISEAKR